MVKSVAVLSILSILAGGPSFAATSSDEEAALAFCRKLQSGETETCKVDAANKLIYVKRQVYGDSEIPECGKIADMGASVFPTKAGWTLTIDVDADGKKQTVSCVFDWAQSEQSGRAVRAVAYIREALRVCEN